MYFKCFYSIFLLRLFIVRKSLKIYAKGMIILISKSPDKGFYKRLAFLALPIIGQDMLNSFVNMLDTFMIGSLGVNEITAVGLSNQLFFIFIILVFGISSGSSILMGQYNGASDVKSVRKTLGISIGLSTLTALFFIYFSIFHSRLVMSIYSKDEAVIEIGAEYLKIVGITYLMCAIIVPVNTALKSMNSTKLPMLTTAIALFCNALLNYIFIYVLNKGVAGAAVATVISRIIEVVVQFLLIKLAKMPLSGKLSDFFAADRAFFKKYILLTLPVILNEFIWGLGTSLYNVAYKFCGTEAQGALQITSTVQNLFQVVGMGVGSAAAIMLSNELGAGENEDAIKHSRKIIVLSLALSVIMSILLLIFSPLLVNIFNVSDSVKAYAYKIVFVIAASMVIKNFNYTTIVGVLRSGGDTLFCMLLDMASVWLIGVPLAFLGAYFLQLPIYWVLAMVQAEELVKFFASGGRTLSNVWAKTLV